MILNEWIDKMSYYVIIYKSYKCSSTFVNLNLFEWEGLNMRVNVTLACTECGERNYITKKNKRNNPERIEMKKYCSRDNKSTLHRETK